MTTKRTVAAGLAMFLAVSCSCHVTGGIYSLGADEAMDLLAGLGEMAKEAEEGTSVRPCPLGGETTVHAEFDSGQRGDTAWTTGRWVLAPFQCVLNASGSRIRTSGKPEVVFTAETAVAGQEGRVKFTVTGGFHWNRPTGGNSCEIEIGLESTDIHGHPGNPVGKVCWMDVMIPLSAMPGVGIGDDAS